ncbi:MAG: AMIN domain-containing protein [Candidatus Aminicenantales bacterium]
MSKNRTRMGRAFALVLMILLAASGLRSQTTAVLKEMNVQKDGARLNVLLKIEGTYAVEASFMPGPPRLVIDLTPLSQILILPYTQIDDIGVLDIRTGQFKPDTVRLVFDLGQSIPAYNIVQTAEGVNVSFWYEGEVPPLQAPVQVEPAKPAEQPAEHPAQAAQVAPAVFAVAKRSNFFIAGRIGYSFFLGSDLAVDKTFDLYGETATLNERYAFPSMAMFEVQFGKYFGRTKLGLSANYLLLKQPGTFTASLPHPFLMDTYRSVAFEAADLKSTTWEVSVFTLFSIMETEKFGLSAGPLLGLATGTMQSLENFNFTEESPYAAANVTITDMTFTKEKFTEAILGAIVNFEYRINEGMSFLFDLRAVYLNPKNIALGQRANLLHLQPVLGIQYTF